LSIYTDRSDRLVFCREIPVSRSSEEGGHVLSERETVVFTRVRVTKKPPLGSKIRYFYDHER
jgi:hypothetical protein